MAGGNHPKSSHHNKPPSSTTRKSRWEPNSSSAKSPADPKPSTAPSPKPKPNPNPSPKHPPLLPFPFPDPAPPPPPAYGFHMLERRTIVLADGSVRSYFALPPDYQDFAPRFPSPLSPARFRLPDYPPAAKRKYGDHNGGPRDDLARQREQLLRNANGLSREQFSAGPSGGAPPPEMRHSKHSRLDGANSRHSQVDQDALKKAFCNFAKLINENVSQKRTYLEDGKQGRLHCLACGTASRTGRFAAIQIITIVASKFVCFRFIYSNKCKVVIEGLTDE